MKKNIAVALLILSLALPLRADEALQNGDFADGITRWHGDGRAPADYANDNPLQASDPFTASGLILPLKHTLWTQVAQDFTSNISGGILKISFKLSPDFVLSTNVQDYDNPSGALGWGWKKFSTPPGSWLVFFTSNNGTKGHYYEIKPHAAAAGAVQTVQVKVR